MLYHFHFFIYLFTFSIPLPSFLLLISPFFLSLCVSFRLPSLPPSFSEYHNASISKSIKIIIVSFSVCHCHSCMYCTYVLKLYYSIFFFFRSANRSIDRLYRSIGLAFDISFLSLNRSIDRSFYFSVHLSARQFQ